MEEPRRKTEKDILFRDEVFRVIGAAIEVHRVLGAGFLEAVYQEALGLEFHALGIPHHPQFALEVRYKEHILKKCDIADFLVFDEIVLELKSMETLGPREIAQLLNYLHATGKPSGLLINFGALGKLEWKRIALTHPSSRSS